MLTTLTANITLDSSNPILQVTQDGMTSAILTLGTFGPLEGIQSNGSASWNLSSLGDIVGNTGQIIALVSGQTYTLPISVTIKPIDSPVSPELAALRMYRVMPQFAANTLPQPGIVYWSVKAQLRDVNANIISESPESSLSQFLLDAEETGLIPNFGGPGGVTWAPLLQKDPLVPSKTFRLLGVLPYPGYINQDGLPQAE